MTSNQTPAGFAHVLTEEMVQAGGLAIDDVAVCDEPFTAARAALTAALPHAKTEAEVREELLEQLAHYAHQESTCPLHSSDEKRRWLITSRWLRAQKGKSDE